MKPVFAFFLLCLSCFPTLGEPHSKWENLEKAVSSSHQSGTTPMLIEGRGASGVFGAGKSLAQKFFAKAPVADTPFMARMAANSNFRNPVASHILPMYASVAARIANQQPANLNMVRLFDVNRATGTSGYTFAPRISEGGGSGIPRGGFSACHTEGLGAGLVGTRAVPSRGGSSGPSQGSFIKRIDKQHAHAERMEVMDSGATTTIREKLFGTDIVAKFRGDRVRPIGGMRPQNFDYAGKVYEFSSKNLATKIEGIDLASMS